MKISTKIASFVAVIIAGVGLSPAAAHAAVGKRLDVPVVRTGLKAVSTLDVVLDAGSCTEWNFAPVSRGRSTVTLTLLNPFGNATVDWHGFVQTSTTFTNDVWHARFDFKTSDGAVVATATGLDGPGMVPEGLTYDFHRFKSIFVNEISFFQITKVDWSGDC
jgi:hypothetical protein